MTKFRAHNPKPTNMVNEFVSEVRRNFLWVSREEMAEKDWFAQEPTTSDSNIPSKNYFNSVGKDTSRYVQKFKRSLCHWPFILASQSLTEALKSCLKSFYVSAIKQDDTFYKKKKSTWAAMDAFSTCIPYADRLISTWKRFSLDYFRLYKACKLSECLLFHWRTLKVTQRSLFYIHQPAWSCKSCYCLERKLPLFTGRC